MAIVAGSIDIASAAQFKELLLGAVERQTERTIVDLTQVGSIDSTGLGVLVSAAKRAAPGSLALVCTDAAMLNVFLLSRPRIASLPSTARGGRHWARRPWR